MNALLAARNLTLRLGGFTLGELSLDLAPGDYLVLLGPSGCGKTTLLKAVAGICRPGRGEILLDGRDVTHIPVEKRGLGYVAQAADLFPHMDVAGNVAFGLRYLGLPKDERDRRFERTADLLGIRGLLSRRSWTLSGGEGKRVALARCLATSPKVLLLDEPLGGLDPNAKLAMLDVLRTIHGELGTATIHVTHDFQEARAIGRRCAVMREGRIEQIGPQEDLFREPATPFVAEFLGLALPARPGKGR